MEQIVQQITQRTGISEEQALQAVQIVAGFLKEKMPAPIDTQIDAILSGQYDGTIEQAQGLLGGLFGSKE